MKIRIETDRPADLANEIRNRVHNKEFTEWSTVEVPSANGLLYKRICYSIVGDDQYKNIQIGFFGPTSSDLENGLHFLDIIPKSAMVQNNHDAEFNKKSGVVLSRLCELLNNNFASVNEYKVYTK